MGSGNYFSNPMACAVRQRLVSNRQASGCSFLSRKRDVGRQSKVDRERIDVVHTEGFADTLQSGAVATVCLRLVPLQHASHFTHRHSLEVAKLDHLALLHG